MTSLVEPNCWRHLTSPTSPATAGRYPRGHVENTPLSEQINARLRKLDNFMSYMRQTTFLRYLRNFIYLYNEGVDARAA